MNGKQTQIVQAFLNAKPDAETIMMASTPSTVLAITWSPIEVREALDAACQGEHAVLEKVAYGPVSTYKVRKAGKP